MTGREIVLGVVILAAFADTAAGVVLWSRRGGRVWALLCLGQAGLWLWSLGWLALALFYPQRYDELPWPMWLAIAGRMILSFSSWRLSFRVLAGNRGP